MDTASLSTLCDQLQCHHPLKKRKEHGEGKRVERRATRRIPSKQEREKKRLKEIFGLSGKGTLVLRWLNILSITSHVSWNKVKNTDPNKWIVSFGYIIHLKMRTTLVFEVAEDI